MRQSIRTLAALALAGLGAGCTSGNSGIEPGFTAVNLNQNKLQLAVGVATFYNAAGAVTPGVNLVATFRQPNGLSATLLNTPTFTGPFTVPAAAAGTTSNGRTTNAALGRGTCSPNVDAGTGHITGSPQALPGTTAQCTTLGQAGGVFAYGIAPDNSTTSGAAQFQGYLQPFFTTFDIGRVAFFGGPPAYANAQTPSYPTGFPGYSQGWTIFAVPPVAGAYNASVNVASANNPGATITAPTATLANAIGLPAFAAPPVFTPDGAGGGTVTCTAPAGVTETIVDLQDTDAVSSAVLYYTVVAQGGGNVTATFAANLGTVSGSGTVRPTLKTGDSYTVQCIGVDYPAFEAGPPTNTQQAPSLGGGQSDITISQGVAGTY